MLDIGETQKARLIAALRNRLRQETQDPRLEAFILALFADAAAEDLIQYNAVQLSFIVKQAWKNFSCHKSQTHIINIYNPDFKAEESPSRPVTIVEIVNDNMPFLFDSITSEIQASGYEARLVLHPILSVTRDAEGRLEQFFGILMPQDCPVLQRDSLIHIHIDRLEEDKERAELAMRLDRILSQLRHVVQDWQPMRLRLTQAIESIRAQAHRMADESRQNAKEWQESVRFLEWLNSGHFIFLGMCESLFLPEGENSPKHLSLIPESGRGLVAPKEHLLTSEERQEFSSAPQEILDFLKSPAPLLIIKADLKSSIHRRAHMDCINLKLFDAEGSVKGTLRILGLFASTIYTKSVRSVPYLRGKVATVLDQLQMDPDSHSGRALLTILETYPRDELFQLDTDLLAQNVREIVILNERPRVRVLLRRDPYDRYLSILVYVPRDRYATAVRERIGLWLTEAYHGWLVSSQVAYPEGVLARIHFIIGHSGVDMPHLPQQKLEEEIGYIVRSWADDLKEVLKRNFEPAHARTLITRYKEAFQEGYTEIFSAGAALRDIQVIEKLGIHHKTEVLFCPANLAQEVEEQDPHQMCVRLYHYQRPISLSARVPLLENMGFKVIKERAYRIRPENRGESYLHDMTISPKFDLSKKISSAQTNQLEACFRAVWKDLCADDGYNSLVLQAELDWRKVAFLRAVGCYLQQLGAIYSRSFMASVLNRHIPIVALLVEFFVLRFDPNRCVQDRAESEARLDAQIQEALRQVENSDEDRILRRFHTIISAILRTNFFQLGLNGEPPLTITFKLDPHLIQEMPSPRPYREVFVYSPRVEGIHMRFGAVARGGIRWSDRPQDFRTEILSLVKAQQVKNAVIVPVGAKGGFVPQRLPINGTREEILAESIEAYKIFISSLLSITDNRKDEKVCPPAQVVRYDSDDPYLVVAADKGTASFSDIANALSEERKFWLGDAFASGGSAGYDHKKMGITAKGAWEAVKRHFREMDHDIQTKPFTIAGVGDMSGDVFGNGLLLSKATKLLAAFDHRHIFIDPDPDPACSWEERARLFSLERSCWADYNPACLSKGGGIFSRNAKSLMLSPEALHLLDLPEAAMDPQVVLRAILSMRVDLLWFGGIGTYIRASTESNSDVGDRSNDPIRVTALDLRCRVIGEGANLGMTQKARIEFNRQGGRCNSDAIDNSAGVNSSDLEVNIKIALDAAVRKGRMTRAARNTLLAAMTEEVATLALRQNYLQTLAISLTEMRGAEDLPYQIHVIRSLEEKGLLDRLVEDLPSDATLTEMESSGQALRRPEIAVIMAHRKLVLYTELLESSVPDDPFMHPFLTAYFPKQMQKDYIPEIEEHRLRREIITTVLANTMINRGGATFIARLQSRVQVSCDQIARAYCVVEYIFQLEALYKKIDALDTQISGFRQLELYKAVQDLLLDQTVWFLRNTFIEEGCIADIVARFKKSIPIISSFLERAEEETLWGVQDHCHDQALTWITQGVPADLATSIAALPMQALAPSILLVSESVEKTPEEVAPFFFSVAGYFSIQRLDQMAKTLRVEDAYDRWALDNARNSLAEAHRHLTEAVVVSGGLEAWCSFHGEEVSEARRKLEEITSTGHLTLSRVFVAAAILGKLAEERSHISKTSDA